MGAARRLLATALHVLRFALCASETRSPLPPLPFQGVGELNIGRTAVRPYGIPSPAWWDAGLGNGG